MTFGSVPGMNLLAAAQTVIAKQEYVRYAWLSRSKSATGVFVNTFAPGVTEQQSIQEIPKQMMREMGLSMEKDHLIIYTTNNMTTLARGKSADIIAFNGRYWQALDSNDWIAIDGWEGVVFVDIGSSSDLFPGVIATPAACLVLDLAAVELLSVDQAVNSYPSSYTDDTTTGCTAFVYELDPPFSSGEMVVDITNVSGSIQATLYAPDGDVSTDTGTDVDVFLGYNMLSSNPGSWYLVVTGQDSEDSPSWDVSFDFISA